MPRDNQRQRVYTTEQKVFGYTLNMDAEFPVLRDAQQYVNLVTSSKLWRKVGGPPFVLVKDGRGRRTAAMVGMTAISLPLWARTRPVILHELSHILTTHLDRRVADHGPEFVQIYRMLIENQLGRDVRIEYDNVAEELRVRWGVSGSSRIRETLGQLESWS